MNDLGGTEINEHVGKVVFSADVDPDKCIGCGLCEAFCPVEVFEMREVGPDGQAGSTAQSGRPRRKLPFPAHIERCWGCETCTGQCPQNALRITGSSEGSFLEGREMEPPLSAERKAELADWANTMKSVLGLRWHVVGIKLVPAGAPLPNVPVPDERYRYCQSLMAARRGRAMMMPANRHACPDGTSILGLTDIPAKLASGELYILFHKLDSVAAAQRMVSERPMLPPRSMDATCVFPLDDAPTEPDTVAVVAQPEQVMWLCMAASYYTGHRFEFHASGYNAQCVETTLLPYTTGQPNISFGCYGCRASSDVGDEYMFMGLPVSQMPTIIKGLRELGKKAIPQSRDKIYLPPLMR